MSKRTRLLLAGALVVGGLAYLIATAVSNTTMFYLTVAEVHAQGLVGSSEPMRLNGDIQAGSIDWRPREMMLSFSLAGEDGSSVQAVYKGPKPDNFEAGIPAIVEGRFASDGVFQVDKLMLACPSRFEAEAHPGATHPKAGD